MVRKGFMEYKGMGTLKDVKKAFISFEDASKYDEPEALY